MRLRIPNDESERQLVQICDASKIGAGEFGIHIFERKRMNEARKKYL